RQVLPTVPHLLDSVQVTYFTIDPNVSSVSNQKFNHPKAIKSVPLCYPSTCISYNSTLKIYDLKEPSY
ncbi:hypothetical protein Tco_0473534, partial [Tanacetum coccineum]